MATFSTAVRMISMSASGCSAMHSGAKSLSMTAGTPLEVVLVFPDNGGYRRRRRDDRMLCVHQRAHGFNLHDLHGLRAPQRPDASRDLRLQQRRYPFSAASFFASSSVMQRADGLGRMLEGRGLRG